MIIVIWSDSHSDYHWMAKPKVKSLQYMELMVLCLLSERKLSFRQL